MSSFIGATATWITASSTSEETMQAVQIVSSLNPYHFSTHWSICGAISIRNSILLETRREIEWQGSPMPSNAVSPRQSNRISVQKATGFKGEWTPEHASHLRGPSLTALFRIAAYPSFLERIAGARRSILSVVLSPSCNTFTKGLPRSRQSHPYSVYCPAHQRSDCLGQISLLVTKAD